MTMATTPHDAEGGGDDSVMAAVDDDGSTSRLVIADVTCDEAWVSVSARQAAPLAEWV
ncbi:MAG: hypothetical protein ABEJ42_08595 [Halobacteriaceae archaeon]